MGARDVISPFNRYIGNIMEVMPLRNNPLNSVLFIDTTKKRDLEVYSGAVSLDEIKTLSSENEDLEKKVRIAMTQKDVGGNPILPAKFYVGGIASLAVDSLSDIELLIKKACVDNQAQAVMLIFDKCKETLALENFLEGLDPVLNSWNSWALLSINEKNELREVLKTTSRISLKKTHKTSTNAFEVGVEAAVAGRVVFMGVGKADGEAKELYGITADKLSIKTGDGGDLTVTEAIAWQELGIDVYTQTIDMKNEMSGFRFIKGNEFINNWELTKVSLDLRNDLIDLRHNTERLGVSDQDEMTVRSIIIDRLEKLTINKTNKELNPNGIIVDYIVLPILLDKTLEDNIFKFKYSVKVSLSGILKYFDIGITGYTDGRIFVKEGE